MKEASGELNLTVVTVVAIAAVLGFFVALWPNIKGKVTRTWDQSATTNVGDKGVISSDKNGFNESQPS